MAGKNEYDVIVIGAGQNGLTAAAYLAKAGEKVVVLEEKKWIGGCTVTKEGVTAPGFRHDMGGTALVFALSNPVIMQDELELKRKYGFEMVDGVDPCVTNLYDDGTSLTIYEDLDKMCAEIAKFSQHDADAYRKFIDYCMPMLPLLGAGMFNAPPKMGLFMNQLDQTPIGQELLRLMLMSAWDLAHQWFEHPKMLNHILKYPTEAMVNPEDGGTAYYLLAMIPVLHIHGRHQAYGKGGIQILPDSLARCIADKGGTILTDHKVERINTKNGRATGVTCANGEEFTAKKAVLATVDPRVSLLKWLDTPLDPKLADKIARIADPAFSGFMTSFALDEDPIFKVGGDSGKSVFVEILPSSLEEFRSYFHEMSYGRVPKPSTLVATIPTRIDSTRAPAGKSVVYLWQFVPYFLADGGPEKWDVIKEDVGNAIRDYFFSFTTNITPDKILGQYYFSPLDYARNNQNQVNGAILGPAPHLFQNLAYRPVPELGQYRTPIEGLYMGGMSSHPGGGITLGGRATAQAIMQDNGIDFDDVVG